MHKNNRNVVPKPELLGSQHRQQDLEEIYRHFMLPTGERHRRRPPYNSKVIEYDHGLRTALRAVFHGKCAFCESWLGTDGGRVCHLRPPSNAATSHVNNSSPDHYAWLAYEWRNLLLLCAQCEDMKGNLFPVDGPRALPLTTWSEAVAAENALLLDPCIDEPWRHLAFTVNGKVYPLSRRGEATIDSLRLNRPKLLETRAVVFEKLTALAPEATDHTVNTLLDVTRIHSGALSTFAMGVCRAIAAMRGIKLPLGYKLLAQTLTIARNMVNNDEWLRAMHTGDEMIAAPYLSQFYSVSGPVPVKRRIHREQPLLESIQIEHFKGIDEIELKVSGDRHRRSKEAPCAMLLGENSVGKSSILQAVVMTLMDGADRRALKLQEEDFLSRDSGSWQLTGGATPKVTLRFEGGMQARLRYHESGRHLFEIKNDFPFTILGYGSRRFFVERGARRKGERVNKTLFDPLATLPDPSLWLRFIDEHTFDAVARAMRDVLALRDEDSILRNEDGNVLVRAHGRETPVERMSDGYRSLFAMAIDIMRNMLEVWDNLEYARGLVLIDEIETHLHPRWKMQVMSALRQAMPQVQFIVTTHDPLCLRGMKNGEVHVLYRDSVGQVQLVEDLPDIETMRAEQILTSDYFGLWTTADMEQETVLMRLAALAGRPEGNLSVSERYDRDMLLAQFSGMPVIGNSPDRQILAEAMTRHLRNVDSARSGDHSVMREDAIDQIVGVLERAMRP
ncbi:AAA family ATPase [Janthinobacterium sp. HLS12-2]|uniref:AAA family ATPase n=1 Tax=Janthinobacterium sp. HLS12-2 TaxID=1259324 RepID=UPI003F279025